MDKYSARLEFLLSAPDKAFDAYDLCYSLLRVEKISLATCKALKWPEINKAEFRIATKRQYEIHKERRGS